MLRDKRARAADAYARSPVGLEDATAGEEMELLAASGVTVIMLAAALGGAMAMEGMEPSHAPDRETVERVRTRIRRRRRLGLPHRDFLKRNCACGSLTDTLDEFSESTTKDEIAKAARRLHKGRSPVFRTEPDPPVTAEVAAESPAPTPQPAPAEVVTETNTKPFRVVKRSHRWYDEPGGIMGNVF
jgi:hypothetical protein